MTESVYFALIVCLSMKRKRASLSVFIIAIYTSLSV